MKSFVVFCKQLSNYLIWRDIMRKIKSKLGLLIAFMFLFTLVPSIMAKASSGINVDGVKSDWTSLTPLATSPEKGTNDFDIDEFYLTNDSGFLYFWVDTKNVPNWGDEGQMLDIGLNINNEDSGYDRNPWGYQYTFSGTAKKPNIHILVRIKGDTGSWVSVNKAANGSSSELFNSSDLKGSQFAVNREVGIEGKIPLSQLGLEDGDKIKAIVVLTGNNGGAHGVFDVIPRTGNQVATSDTKPETPNVLSTYTSEYTVAITGEFVPVLDSVAGPEVVVQENTATYVARLNTIDGGTTDMDASEVEWAVTDEEGNPSTLATIDATGKLTTNKLPEDATSVVVLVKATRKSNPDQVKTKKVYIVKERIPRINNDGTVTFFADHDGDTLFLVGSMNGWDNTGIEMKKNSNGIFELTIKLEPGTYQYKFLPVSGSWDGDFTDPLNPVIMDGNSAFTFTADDVENGYEISPEEEEPGEEPGSEDPDDEEPGEEPTDEKPADEEEPKDGDQNNNPGNNNGGKSDTNKPLPQTGSPIDTLVLTLIGALTMVAGGFVLFKRKRNLAK